MSNLKQTEPVSGPKPVLSIRDLCLDRGGRTLFDKLNLEVNRGEVIAVVGASGSGKSSLLELIFSDPRHPPLYSGVIHFDRAQAALVMQDGALLDHLSVLDNLQLVSAYSGSKRTNTELLELLERLNIPSSQAGQPAGHLSGGEKRRVAVARALVYQPELIFFDEPDAGLDIANRRELAALLRELVEIHRTTVVIVTHDSLLTGLVAHKVHVLEEGRLQQAFAWEGFPATPAAATQRREAVETLAENARLPQMAAGSTGLDKATSLPRQLARDVWRTVASVLRPNPSPRHYLAVFWKMLQMGALSGIPFFFLVGAMLGATTIVVVRNLVVSVVRGLDVPEMVRHTVEYFLSAYPSLREWLIAQIMDRVDFNVLAEPTLKRLVEEPDMVLDHLNGLYIAVFVPAIAAILFAARSGSVVSAWLGVLTFGRKVEALKSLGVNPELYLRSPSATALVASYLFTAVVFGLGMWVGSFLTAQTLYQVQDAAHLLAVTPAMLHSVDGFYKLAIYGAIVPLTICTLGLAPKGSVDSVGRHTTMAIIYSTVMVAVVELGFALKPWQFLLTG